MTVMLCGPARGTKEKPYRCICCRKAYASGEELGVSICWHCMSGNTKCKRCRKRGIFISDFRVGGWKEVDGKNVYDAQGGKGHRLVSFRGSVGVMRCRKRIPIRHFGGGEAVVPPCKTCWPKGH